MRKCPWAVLAIILALLPVVGLAQPATPSSATPSADSIATRQLEAIVPTASSIFGDDGDGLADYAPDVKPNHAMMAHGWDGGPYGERLFIEGLVSDPSHEDINTASAFLADGYRQDALFVAMRRHAECNPHNCIASMSCRPMGIGPVTNTWVGIVFCSFTPNVMVRITISGGVASESALRMGAEGEARAHHASSDRSMALL